MNRIEKVENRYQLTTSDGTVFTNINLWFEKKIQGYQLKFSKEMIEKTGRQFIRQTLVDKEIELKGFYEFDDKDPSSHRTFSIDYLDYLTKEQREEYDNLKSRIKELEEIAKTQSELKKSQSKFEKYTNSMSVDEIKNMIEFLQKRIIK